MDLEQSHQQQSWLTQQEFESDMLDVVAASPFSARIMQPRGSSRVNTRRRRLDDENKSLGDIDTMSDLAAEEETEGSSSQASNRSDDTQLLRADLAALWRDDPVTFVLRLAPACLAHEETMLCRILRDHESSPVGTHVRRILALHNRRLQQFNTAVSQSVVSPAPHYHSSTKAATASTSSDTQLSPVCVPATGVLARNRRYRRLQQLLAEGSFFSADAIKERDSKLYHDVLGVRRGCGAGGGGTAANFDDDDDGDADGSSNDGSDGQDVQTKGSADGCSPGHLESDAMMLGEALREVNEALSAQARSKPHLLPPCTSRLVSGGGGNGGRASELTAEVNKTGGKCAGTGFPHNLTEEEFVLEGESERLCELVEAASGRFMAGFDAEFVDYRCIDNDACLDDEMEAALDAGDNHEEEC